MNDAKKRARGKKRKLKSRHKRATPVQSRRQDATFPRLDLAARLMGAKPACIDIDANFILPTCSNKTWIVQK